MNEPKKPSGILWKLTAEEKEALREVCGFARAMGDDYISDKINQLLGKEK
jgi:hypothetical protein